jgi:hypothetical protein
MKANRSERRIRSGASDMGGSANARGAVSPAGTPPRKSKN